MWRLYRKISTFRTNFSLQLNKMNVKVTQMCLILTDFKDNLPFLINLTKPRSIRIFQESLRSSRTLFLRIKRYFRIQLTRITLKRTILKRQRRKLGNIARHKYPLRSNFCKKILKE